MSQQEVVAALQRARREQGKSAEYQKLRKDLPKDWPI
jgi:hypothetical protein